MKIIATIFNPNPALAIWGIDNWPLAKTLAFGPVPEGSINAHEAAMVAGTINKKGWKCPASETPANTGRNTAVVAVLEFISVKNTIPATTKRTTKKIDIPSKLRLQKRRTRNRYDNFSQSFYTKVQNSFVKIAKIVIVILWFWSC